MSDKKIQVNQIDEKGKKSMRNRIIVALILCVLAFPCLIFGSYAFLGLIVVAFSFTVYEIVHAMNKKVPGIIYAVVAIYGLLIAFFPLLFANIKSLIFDAKNYKFILEAAYGGNSNQGLWASTIVFGLFIITLFVISIASERFDVSDLGYIFMMTSLVALGMQSACYIRFLPYNSFGGSSDFGVKYLQSGALLVFILLATFLDDIFAYFVGVFFGKHHMVERISPKKTWEGFFGGWFFATLLSLAFALPLCLTDHPLVPGILDKEHIYLVIILAFILPLLGVIGDLAFSLVKRHYGVKDYGWVLGAHGGVLDRIDSVIFTLIGSSCFISICFHIMSLTL